MTPDKIEKLCLKARQAIAQRDWEKAKQSYLMALGLKSDLPDVHYGLATVYFQLRELTSAAHHFREVTRLDPVRAGAFVNLGAVLNLLGQYDEALTALRRAIQLDGRRVEAYYNLGLVYRRKGQADMAIQAYREALRLNPRMPDAHLNLANLHVDKEQYRQALQHYEEALKGRPNWDKALEGLEHARAALAGEPKAPPAQAAPAQAPAADGLTRAADPVADAQLLNTLHQSTIGTQDLGEQFEQILATEVEPAIKDLSSCLLYPDGPRSELDACVTRFEAALGRLRAVQGHLHHHLVKLRQLSEHFPQA
jgi:tetratricopeptide (TPR) repeat protein